MERWGGGGGRELRRWKRKWSEEGKIKERRAYRKIKSKVQKDLEKE